MKTAPVPAVPAVADAAPPQADSGRGLSLPRLWAFVALVLPVIAAMVAKLSTVDLAYQLRAGHMMLETGLLLRTDTLTFTASGMPWLDQQWGAQILLSLVFRAGRWDGLALVRAALVGSTFLFVYRSCRAVGSGQRLAAWLTIASFVVALGTIGLRPQLFGMTLFALIVWLAADRRAHRGRLWLVPVVVVVWANLHGSFVLGPVVLGLAWLEDRRARRPDAGRVLLVGLVAIAASIANPFGLRLWSYAVSIPGNELIRRVISEWQPPSVTTFDGAIFFLSVGAVIVVLARRGRPTPWPALVALGVFLFLGLSAVRGRSWWALAIPSILAPLLPEGSMPEAGTRSDLRWLNACIASFLVVAAFAVLPWWRGRVLPESLAAPLDNAPPGVTAALDRVLDPGERIFNGQIWGSWLEYAFPGNPVAVDSRIEVFPATVWLRYWHVSSGREGWQGVLDRWDVDVVAAHRGQQAGLIPLIREDPGWRLVHDDDDGLVFVRT